MFGSRNLCSLSPCCVDNRFYRHAARIRLALDLNGRRANEFSPQALVG